MADNTSTIETVRQAAGGRLERARLFLSEVRNELKRVTWPTRREVYATTIVVIIFSAVIGMYLFALDQALIAIVEWLFGFFGAA
jgi:preprotein translocase subunit SecE